MVFYYNDNYKRRETIIFHMVCFSIIVFFFSVIYGTVSHNYLFSAICFLLMCVSAFLLGNTENLLVYSDRYFNTKRIEEAEKPKPITNWKERMENSLTE